MAVKIRYKGVDIAAIEPGKTTTVKCSGKKMKTDVSVTAEALKLQEKTADKNGDVTADSGFDGLSKVTVNVEGEVLPKYDGEVIIEGEPESGGGDGGSAEFNIAYGDTAPTDTSKLWVKANEPEAVKVTSNLVVGNEELITGVSEMKEALYGHSAAAVGTKIYTFGGYYNGYINTRDKAYVYDTVANANSEITSMPFGLYDMGVAAVGAKIYLFGGANNGTAKDYVREYDTENDTYTTVASLAQSSRDMATAAVGTKIYLFGGAYGSNSKSNAIYEFDTEQKTITKIGATLPKSAYGIAAAAVGTKIYLFGGYNGSDYFDTINVFDTENYSIETLSVTLPVATYAMASAAIGKKIYLFGGFSGTLSDAISVFDTESNTIATLDAKLPSGLFYIEAVAVGTTIFLVGASNNKTIHKFVTSFPLAANNLLIEASIKTNAVNILPNVELGVNNVYLGNAEGNGEKVEAYLHNGTEWVEV